MIPNDRLKQNRAKTNCDRKTGCANYSIAAGASGPGRIDFASFLVSAAGRAVAVAVYFLLALNPNHDPTFAPSALIDKPARPFQLAGLNGGQGIAIEADQRPFD